MFCMVSVLPCDVYRNSEAVAGERLQLLCTPLPFLVLCHVICSSDALGSCDRQDYVLIFPLLEMSRAERTIPVEVCLFSK